MLELMAVYSAVLDLQPAPGASGEVPAETRRDFARRCPAIQPLLMVPASVACDCLRQQSFGIGFRQNPIAYENAEGDIGKLKPSDSMGCCVRFFCLGF